MKLVSVQQPNDLTEGRVSACPLVCKDLSWKPIRADVMTMLKVIRAALFMFNVWNTVGSETGNSPFLFFSNDIQRMIRRPRERRTNEDNQSTSMP